MISIKFLLLLLFGLFHYGFCQYESVFPGIFNPEFRGGFSEIDTDTDDIIPDSLSTQHSANGGIYFQDHFPNIFETNPFFSTFGGFKFGHQNQPWWKGPNVCTETEEKDESESTESDGTDLEVNPGDLFNSFQFTLNSCVEKANKHICKKIKNKSNKRTSITVTKQCCHGFTRPKGRENDITAACEKLDVKSFTETAEELGSKEFMRSVDKNDLKEKFNTNITLFMPTDEAFTDFSEQMLENNLILFPGRMKRAAKQSSGITTKDLILNHVVNGRIYKEDMENEKLLSTNFGNSTIRINIFAKKAKKNAQSQLTYTANCAPILKMNKHTTNGVLNVIDNVLVPVTDNLMEIIRSRNDMTVLKTILEKSNLAKDLEKNNPTTIFAPTDSAFEKLDPHMKKVFKEGGACAANILKNHILKFTLCGTAIIPQTTVYNVLGESLNFTKAETVDEKKSEQADLVAMDEVLINGEVRITETDIMGSNGVIHVVDTIMPTESSLPITTLMKMKNITIFRNLIDAAGLTDEFDQLDNVTFFAPTDKSLKTSKWKKMLEENSESLRNNEELKAFLKYHVSKPLTKTSDLSERMIETLLPNNELRINLFSTHTMFYNILNRATVNCARLVHFDDESCGTVLHQVDKPLTPPTASIIEQLENNPQYSNFYSLIKKTNISDILGNESESFTVFVPKNDVFEEFSGLSQDQEMVESFIKSHIVNDVVCCAGIVPTNWNFARTVETLNNQNLRISRDCRPKVQNAGIIKCDIIATNGIIHEVNELIVPKEKTCWPVHKTLF